MPSQTTIINRLGLHARAAARLVALSKQFPCEIRIERMDGEVVDGKNIMAVMMLAASQGTEIKLTTQGEQDTAALQALVELIAARFGEES